MTPPVTVTITLLAKDREQTLKILAQTLPATRTYEGCQYCHTLTQVDHPHEIILIQGWDTRSNQAAYFQWRQETGDRQALIDTLMEPPTVKFWEMNPA
jgi:quinol monooxygenase YgiN